MFKKLKQKIEQDVSSPGPRQPAFPIPGGDSGGKQSADRSGQSSGSNPITDTSPTALFSLPADLSFDGQSSQRDDDNSSISPEMDSSMQDTSLANSNHSNATDQTSVDKYQSVGDTPDGIDAEDVDRLTDRPDEVTPRRMNLAATVLKYGEEISAKNEIIGNLERQLLDMSQQGKESGAAPDTRITELENSLSASRGRVKELEIKVLSQKKTITNLELSLTQLQDTKQSNVTMISNLERELSSREREVTHLSRSLEESDRERIELEASIQKLQSQIVDLNSKLQDKDANIAELSLVLRTKDSMATTTATTSLSEVGQLKTKLSRAHSLSKDLEKQLEEKNAELSTLIRENRDIKSSLENNKQKALDELLSVSEEESELRTKLSSHIQRLAALESQHKSQTRLLADKQRNLVNLEEALEKQLKNSEKEREKLVTDYTNQITSLERNCQALTLALSTETQTLAKTKEEMDSLREETLDKQLDDEKQLSDLHEQLSVLRGEVRQLERAKKREVEQLQSELSTKDASISRLESRLSTATLDSEDRLSTLNKQIADLQTQIDSLRTDNDEVKKALENTQHKLQVTDSEKDELYLRNADLSSKLEKCKMELISVSDSHESERANLQQKLVSNEELERRSGAKHEVLQEKIAELEGRVHVSERLQQELGERTAEIDSLKLQLAEQEKTIVDKTKSVKLQQQTINDLKKTIKRELRGLGESLQSGPGEISAGRSQDLMERVRSSPALSELDKYDSPIEDNIPLPAAHRNQTTTSSGNSGLAQQYRHEVNGFCGHKDINFEYLKNVVFSFLISRDSESIHLVKAIAVILEFTPTEEKLLKETLEWKMSWWPSSKKPSKKYRK